MQYEKAASNLNMPICFVYFRIIKVITLVYGSMDISVRVENVIILGSGILSFDVDSVTSRAALSCLVRS